MPEHGPTRATCQLCSHSLEPDRRHLHDAHGSSVVGNDASREDCVKKFLPESAIDLIVAFPALERLVCVNAGVSSDHSETVCQPMLVDVSITYDESLLKRSALSVAIGKVNDLDLRGSRVISKRHHPVAEQVMIFVEGSVVAAGHFEDVGERLVQIRHVETIQWQSGEEFVATLGAVVPILSRQPSCDATTAADMGVGTW